MAREKYSYKYSRYATVKEYNKKQKEKSEREMNRFLYGTPGAGIKRIEERK